MYLQKSLYWIVVFAFVFALLLGGQTFASVTASISGTVKDATGASLPGATVTATDTGTGINQTRTTNAQGFYSFQELPLGSYVVTVEQKGFKQYQQTNLVLDVNEARTVDATLQVGQVSEKIEVAADALHVETVSSQMGEVIEGKEMTAVPLVTRSYTDLLALQPGVVSSASGMTGAYAGSFISAGFAVPPVSGDLNSGALSVNGMRESANGFILNGILVQEVGYSGAGAIPNLDSIAEFRILTNNTDAEYGNYAGAQINVVTKSGTNQWHGNVFEFLRNTDLDAKNYFDVGNRGAYNQNQFGGTFGGPVIRDKIFFFADYQGNRVVQAVPQTIAGAPSSATEAGDFSGIAASFNPVVNGVATPTTVNGDAFAAQLTQQLGQPVSAGEPYYFPGCTSTSQCVLPNAHLPKAAFNPISTKLLPFILPAAPGSIGSGGTGVFSTTAGKINLTDNKFSGRIDANSGFGGLLTAYYYFDRYSRVDPYWPGNSPVYPGFSINGKGQTHNITLGSTKSFGASMVNEFRLGYFRLNTTLNQPLGGKQTSLSDLGFASGANGAPGIFPGTPGVEGVPEIDFNSFIIGVPSRPNQLIDNIYQVVDNFSKAIGTHNIKFGGQFHFNQLEENLSNVANGNYFFGSAFSGQPSETGSDFVDFLLGAPASYVQGQSYPSYGRSFYMGLYGQDSWRVGANLTLNFGLRYDVSSPWWEKYNEIQTLIPGEQSVVFPGSPKGWVFPGDPGVPRTLAPTRWNNFAPRFGLAYAMGDHDGLLGKLFGKAGASSIRAGYALSFSALEGATDFNEIGDAPFGNYTGQNEPTFAAPFTNRASGQSVKNLFPVAPPPKHFSAKNPASGAPYDTLAEFFTAFGTIGSSPAFNNNNKLPYAQNYELSFQRQLSPSDVVTLSYVGTQGRRLLASVSANPGSPSLCLSVSQASQVAPGSPTCGPGGENNIYTTAAGTQILTTRSPFSGVVDPTLGPITTFGNDSYFITKGWSNYNSAQVNYRHTSGGLQLLLGYTFSKSFDDSSGYGEQYNPVNASLSRGLSAFDSTNNFVVSYNYLLPLDRLGGPKQLTGGWAISGITRFETGLPVTLVETDDNSLLGTAFGGPIVLPVDTPDKVGSLHIMNPRNSSSHYYFDPTAFASSAIGSEGDARRRFFHGPGVNNFDTALVKDTKLSEIFNLQFRAEWFNVFNHTQFSTPSGILSGTFAQVTQAAAPRIGQVSLKLNF
jgi:Carboxypeptidase regulatory-like domain/TonB dependent receptor